MLLGVAAATLAVVFAVVFVGSLVTGVTGFGYAIVATATLAAVLDPSTAVVVMILPLLAAYVSLVRELDRPGLWSCAKRFWPFVDAATAGTLAGMAVLGRVPADALAVARVAASGVVSGASNVGVQVVAYLESLDLDRSTFVGVVAMVFVGVGSVRVVAAAALGLYGDGALLPLSAAAMVPGLVGVAAGRRVRPVVPARVERVGVYALLSVIGVRLVAQGL